MKKLGAELKRHALTAISYMLPLVVASGLLIAIGNLMGGENVTELSKMTIPSALTTLGVMGMGLLPSFISGYIAYSIADRPGIAPGFLMGQIASFLGAGFLGGMVGGYLVGYIALFIKNNLKVPKWAEALMPMMIVPTLSAIIAGLIMFFVVGTPIAMNDIIRTVICTATGCGVTGAISFSLDVGSKVPSGGVFVIPAMSNPIAALIALLAGTAVTGVLLVLIKKKKTEEDEPMVDEKEEDLDLSGFTIS